MTIRIELRRGKEVLVISTVPSKRIRRAKNRTRKRMLEIYRHFPEERLRCTNSPLFPLENIEEPFQ